MSNPLPSPVYLDSPATTVQMVGAPVFSSPFAGVNVSTLMTQKWQDRADNWTALALNTPHPDYSSFLLTSEGPREDIQGGYVRWERTYCAVPASRDDYTSINYNFIGYYGVTNPTFIGLTQTAGALLGRPRFTRNVTCRVHYDYKLTATPETSFTLNLGQRYYIPMGVWNNATPPVFVPSYSDPVQSALHGLPVDSLFDITGAFAFTFPVATVPTRSAYELLRTLNDEIIVEDSTISRWQGNIYQMITKYVIAQ